MSESGHRLSRAVTAHSLILAGLSVGHSLHKRGLRRTLLFAAFGNALPLLGELLAVNVLKVLRHHVRPQAGGVPLAIVLGWYNVGYGSLDLVESITRTTDSHRNRRSRTLAPAVALAATSFDLLLDPFGLDLGLWEWNDGGPYASEVEGPNGKRGVPLLNFAGWIALTSSVTLAYQRYEPESKAACAQGSGHAPGAGRGAALLLLSYYLPAAAWALKQRRPKYLVYSAPFAMVLGGRLRRGSSSP